ncbi:MAG TPA: undecaprenyl-diphosphate phosphatase [Candidatus Bilamarchaeum sp.]|nr:undecaprenyl-diphosphate phosphatase [Candidatus Bilamarchaeum sp.]
MDYFEAIVLGIIQGIAEWLPVSSKAMVAIAGRFLFGMDYQDALSTAIFLHSGTLAAAIAYFRKDLICVAKSAFDAKSDRRLLIFLFIATALTGLLGAPLLFIALNFDFPEWLFTIAIGALLIGMAVLQKIRKSGSESEPTPKRAVMAGLAQGLAGIPGISRSGTVLAALLGEGFSLEEGMRLSFLMSIPAVAGVEMALPILKGGLAVDGPMLAGSAAAAVVGYLTIGAFLKIAARPDFYKVTLGLGLAVIALGAILLF